ncbi:MAG TPA: ATP-binding protein [Anaerolineales bacterium]|nr:ATP-binding protein [Anaerolineales bacterium]
MAHNAEQRSLTLTARFENLTEVRKFAAQAAVDCGLKDAAVYAVQMAVDEAFTNIIEHAYGGECDQVVHTTCVIEADGLTLILRDCGRSFNPDAVPDPDLDVSLQERKEGGLGLFFMRQLMDEVHFEFSAEGAKDGGCNILRMTKRKDRNV